MPAAPPNGSTLATALPVRFRLRARWRLSPGRAAVSTNEYTNRPVAHSTVSSTVSAGVTSSSAAPTSCIVVPTTRGST